MRVFLDSNLKTAPKEDLRGFIEDLFHQVEDQINEGTQLVGLVGNEAKLPKGIQRGDVVVKFDPDTQQISLGIFNGKSVFYSETATQQQLELLNRFLGNTSTNAAPTPTEYPASGDWGFHTDTTGPTQYLATNIGGTIYKVTLT